jgi:hypothetical protein
MIGSHWSWHFAIHRERRIMGTTSDTIVNLFLSRIADFRLDQIFINSGSTVLVQYVEPWLMSSIQDFDVCDQDLSYVQSSGSSIGYFVEDLTSENQILLSLLMTKYWEEKSMKDRTAMGLYIQDRDMKSFSPSQNIIAKMNAYNSLLEEIDLKLTKYAYKRINMANWENQQFYP